MSNIPPTIASWLPTALLYIQGAVVLDRCASYGSGEDPLLAQVQFIPNNPAQAGSVHRMLDAWAESNGCAVGKLKKHSRRVWLLDIYARSRIGGTNHNPIREVIRYVLRRYGESERVPPGPDTDRRGG